MGALQLWAWHADEPYDSPCTQNDLSHDRYGHSHTMPDAGIVNTPAAAVYCWVLFTDAPVIMLYVALGLIGGYRGFNNPAVESIFADSVATGQRCAGCKDTSFLMAPIDTIAPRIIDSMHCTFLP
jgi:hypothetical protein